MKRIVRIRDEEFSIVPSVGDSWDFWGLVERGEWEPHTYRILELCLSPENSFVDLGAWIGPLTLYAARRCRWVYAVEPDPIARQELYANLEANGISNVTVDKRAISDCEGTAFLGNGQRWGNSESSLLCDNSPLEVQTIRPETFFAEHEIRNCGLLKIDTEGAEGLILPASAAFLRELDLPIHLSLHAMDEIPREALQKSLLAWGFEWDGKPGEVFLEQYDASKPDGAKSE